MIGKIYSVSTTVHTYECKILVLMLVCCQCCHKTIFIFFIIYIFYVRWLINKMTPTISVHILPLPLKMYSCN